MNTKVMLRTLTLPVETIRITEEADLCVIGGSCTGVFAAVRAARLGAKVVLIERENRFGGVATLGLVGMWHTFFDYTGSKQIIGGLTLEMAERLDRYGAVSNFRDAEQSRRGIRLNTDELTLELDALVTAEPNIRIHFQTSYLGVVKTESGKRIDAVLALNKSGKFAIRAKEFIDASGDGLLCRDAGVPMHTSPCPQPPTACCRLENHDRLKDLDLKAKIEANRNRIPNLPCGYYWGMKTPGSSIDMLAGTRVADCDCANADDITRAELESRRQIRALLTLLRQEYPEPGLSLQGLPAAIGIRESLHLESRKQVCGDDLLHRRIPEEETIGCGTYPVDIHHNGDDRIEFYTLDGTHRIFRAHTLEQEDRWLPEGEILPFYRIPMSPMIPRNVENLLASGRMLDADPRAFGALRVMVNLNQCGEAAGAGAVQALNAGRPVQELNTAELRKTLIRGGSILG